jgi:hypothetical protein
MLPRFALEIVGHVVFLSLCYLRVSHIKVHAGMIHHVATYYPVGSNRAVWNNTMDGANTRVVSKLMQGHYHIVY